jgi:hypothetical protein
MRVCRIHDWTASWRLSGVRWMPLFRRSRCRFTASATESVDESGARTKRQVTRVPLREVYTIETEDEATVHDRLRL